MSEDFTPNTEANPFWRQLGAVVVRLNDRRQQYFSCPSCARRMMDQIAAWRPATEEDRAAEKERLKTIHQAKASGR